MAEGKQVLKWMILAMVVICIFASCMEEETQGSQGIPFIEYTVSVATDSEPDQQLYLSPNCEHYKYIDSTKQLSGSAVFTALACTTAFVGTRIALLGPSGIGAACWLSAPCTLPFQTGSDRPCLNACDSSAALLIACYRLPIDSLCIVSVASDGTVRATVMGTPLLLSPGDSWSAQVQPCDTCPSSPITCHSSLTVTNHGCLRPEGIALQ